MIRLYFNQHGALPWSIDTGPDTPETQYAKVMSFEVAGSTVYKPLAAGEEPLVTPCAWIQFDNARLALCNGSVCVVKQ